MPAGPADPILSEIEQLTEKVRGCTLCDLHLTRSRAVPGVGTHKPFVMFVGEGPGAAEDAAGLPFVGRAGKLLDELLLSINYSRKDVYITNVIKCRPPNNRDPLPEEVAQCKPYLDRQIELLNPALLVALGRHALKHFTANYTITQAHGTAIEYGGRLLLPLYHPAAGLRNPAMAARLRQDFQRIPSLLRQALITNPSTD